MLLAPCPALHLGASYLGEKLKLVFVYPPLAGGYPWLFERYMPDRAG